MNDIRKICPYCQFPIENNKTVKVCPECNMVHHRECWLENKGCTTFACTGGILDLTADIDVDGSFIAQHSLEEWYLFQNGNRFGPYKLEELQHNKSIQPYDLVWNKNYSDWVRADHAIPSLHFGSHINEYVPDNYGFVLLGNQYAGFWLRAGALVIDYTILITALFITAFFSYDLADNSIFTLLFMWLYYALFEFSSLQATPGKLALGLKVTDMNGGQLTFGRATGRHFGKLLSGIILGIGYFMAGFTENKQALHDQLAGCLVLKK